MSAEGSPALTCFPAYGVIIWSGWIVNCRLPLELATVHDTMCDGVTFAGGSGSLDNPYQVSTAAQLQAIGTNGANLTFDHLIQLKYTTKFANAPQGAAALAPLPRRARRCFQR